MKTKEELQKRHAYNTLACNAAKKVVEQAAKEEEFIKTLDTRVLQWLVKNVQWAMYQARIEEDKWIMED
jgi:hypothetical protein